jgi:hypothetical protein
MVTKLPNEIIDKVIIQLADLDIANELKRYYAYGKIYIPSQIYEHSSEINMNYACQIGNLELVKYLHSIGKDCSERAMNYACIYGHLDIVKYLHSIRKNITGDHMYIAIYNKHFEILEYLCNFIDYQPRNNYGSSDLIRNLLEHYIVDKKPKEN